MSYFNRPYAKRFRPWWHDYRAAAAWLLGAAGAVALTLAFAARGDAGQAPLVVGIAAGVALVVARFYWYRGRARHHGKRVETSSRSQFERILPFGWSVDHNPPFVPRVGDVDLLIRTKRHGFVVEIKSWHVWDGSKHNRAAATQAKTLLQAFAGREGRKWQAVVWLPNGGRKRARLDRELIVVVGSPRSLIRVFRFVTYGFF